MSLQPWWELWPERLEREFEALRRAGVVFERDDDAFTDGQLVLRLDAEDPRGEGRLGLVATFPALYPHFRFEVMAPGLSLAHHQHARSKTLCLFPRGTEHWLPSMLLGDVLRARLPVVLRAGEAIVAEVAAGLEDHQAEPFSDYLEYVPESIVLVDGDWSIPPEAAGGTLELGLDTTDKSRLRAAVLEVRGYEGQSLAKASVDIQRLFPVRALGRWIRMKEQPSEINPDDFLNAILKLRGSLANPFRTSVGANIVDLIGVRIPEETGWRQVGEGWVFLERRMARASGKRSANWQTRFIRAGRAGVTDIRERVPELKSLVEARVAVAGLGGLGSQAVIELARAGVKELVLIDHDHVDPATIARWPLGMAAGGRTKAEALRAFLEANWPHVAVTCVPHRIGSEELPKHAAQLRASLGLANLILDATAELGVQHYLSDFARAQKKPYVCVWTQPGAWGGLVAQIVPDKPQGCWWCLQKSLTDGDIPYPPADQNGNLQPRGCADPTFTGAGFDLSWIASCAVRTAVAILTHERVGGYPLGEWDVLTMKTRDARGRSIPPTSEGFSIARHKLCPVCHAA